MPARKVVRSHHPHFRGQLVLTVSAVGPRKDAGMLAVIEDVVRHAPPSSHTRWSGFLVAEVDGKPAAALSGYDTRTVSIEAFVQAWRHALIDLRGWTPEQWEEFDRRRAPFRSAVCKCDDSDGNGWWVVEWVGTLPEYRGMGLMHRLLLSILQEGRKRGLKRAKVTGFIGNIAAQRAYEKVGFKEVSRVTGFDLHSSPNVRVIPQYHSITSPLFQQHFESPGLIKLTIMDL